MRRKIDRPVRSPAFAERFRIACDQSPHVPELHDGRYTYVAAEYNRKANDKISVETVRKWQHGESAPRPAKIPILSAILGCDPVWLQIGSSSAEGTNPIPVPIVREHETEGGRKSTNGGISSEIPIPLRPELTVLIKNLPVDLTEGEAKRIAGIIQAYATG